VIFKRFFSWLQLSPKKANTFIPGKIFKFFSSICLFRAKIFPPAKAASVIDKNSEKIENAEG